MENRQSADRHDAEDRDVTANRVKTKNRLPPQDNP
jgi:hypothetical protein